MSDEQLPKTGGLFERQKDGGLKKINEADTPDAQGDEAPGAQEKQGKAK